ncbi:MAG: hypothetical protein KJO77_01150 [Bacteroidia bacterium]|nr:hypothetical protein [Bacteroidia bacterium]NND52467.1 hypothetical protein [Flavobacteriaceae bacterium]
MRRFKQFEIPNLEFSKATKKPIPIRCIQIDEAFEVETMEGIMQGKKGDWLMVGIDGEMYVCDADIFNRTYNLIE